MRSFADLPPPARLPLLVFGMLSLLTGVLGGLARLALEVPAWAAAQAGNHGVLMIAAFFGTVISLERAVALARGWAYLAPLGAGLGGLALLAGAPPSVGTALLLLAAAVLTAGSGLILSKQTALFTATLALGAACWLVGNLVWAGSGRVALATPWWLAFLVITIAGERLELTRFLNTPASAQRGFAVILLALVGGAAWFLAAEAGGVLFAAALAALAGWLLRYDIARRTVRQDGLTRFIAVCLLAGYAWLAAGALFGLAGGFAPASPWRDATLHAIGLGFVFSMVFGHAPIIFPAVVKVKIPYHPVFYLPLALLHVTLLLRIGGGLAGFDALRQMAAVGNALALLAFILTMLVSVWRGRR